MAVKVLVLAVEVERVVALAYLAFVVFPASSVQLVFVVRLAFPVLLAFLVELVSVVRLVSHGLPASSVSSDELAPVVWLAFQGLLASFV